MITQHLILRQSSNTIILAEFVFEIPICMKMSPKWHLILTKEQVPMWFVSVSDSDIAKSKNIHIQRCI